MVRPAWLPSKSEEALIEKWVRNGNAISALAKELGIDRKTLKKYLSERPGLGERRNVEQVPPTVPMPTVVSARAKSFAHDLMLKLMMAALDVAPCRACSATGRFDQETTEAFEARLAQQIEDFIGFPAS
jgi:hypothetical protein